MKFVRGALSSDDVPLYKAIRSVEAVEEAYRRSEKSIGDEAVLSYMLDRMS